jgi:hypothetical protein
VTGRTRLERGGGRDAQRAEEKGRGKEGGWTRAGRLGIWSSGVQRLGRFRADFAGELAGRLRDKGDHGMISRVRLASIMVCSRPARMRRGREERLRDSRTDRLVKRGQKVSEEKPSQGVWPLLAPLESSSDQKIINPRADTAEYRLLHGRSPTAPWLVATDSAASRAGKK